MLTLVMDTNVRIDEITSVGWNAANEKYRWVFLAVMKT